MAVTVVPSVRREAAPTSLNRWSLATYACTGVLAAGISACVAGIPLSLTDFTAYLIDSEPYSLGQLFLQRMQTAYNFRPMLWVQMKVVFELSHGSYFLAFKTFHIAQIVLTLLLCARLLRVRTAAAFAAALVAMTILLGLHTTINTLREGPMTMPLTLALALTLSSARRSSWWRDAGAAVLLAVASLTVELGLLLWVIFLGGRLLGWRGVSWRGVAAASAVVAAYLGYRLLFLGTAAMEFRGTGFGLAPREPEQLQAMFGGRMFLLYAYNVGASLLTVLLSEPREGVWWFVRAALNGELRPWMWINVVSSALTTLILVWYAATRVSSWRRLEFADGDRFLLLAMALSAGNAAISFAYTRDVIMQPAGMMYALAAYAAIAAAAERLPALSRLRRGLVTVVLMVVAVTWSARTAGTAHVLRDTAFDKRNQWAEGIELLQDRHAMPTDHRKAIVFTLRRHALGMNTPVPALNQPWAERWTDRLY